MNTEEIENRKLIGQNIRTKRIEMNLTQKQLAETIGLTSQTLQKSVYKKHYH